ncbi:MAG: DUF4328 domain-containing protein [Bacteroidetes bacterium]|nr:DUF4328 domain-containing protein [Bacteroidota bacterium]
MNLLRPNEKRAKTAIMFIWIMLIIEIIAIVSEYFEYTLVKSVYDGFYVSVEETEANDTRQIIIGVLNLVFFTISGITFIKWFRRAYFNLHIKVNNLSYKESWAAASWFVPIVNIYRSYQIMKELYIETGKILNTNASDAETSKSTSTYLLGIWWFLWLTSGFIGQFIIRLAFNAETLEDYMASNIANIVASIIGILLAIITVKIIKNYASMEDTLILDQEVLVDNNS